MYCRQLALQYQLSVFLHIMYALSINEDANVLEHYTTLNLQRSVYF